MYNRYIPQPDGSYRRNRMPDPRPTPTPHHPKLPDPPKPLPSQPDPPCPPPPKQACPPPHSRQDTGALSFLRQLLPKEFDTGDLFIVMLLLLMAGDCEEDRNTALLTLALYFLM